MIIDPFINGFTPNEVKINLHICNPSIITFGIMGFCLGFSNTTHVDSLDRFRKPVLDKVKTDVYIKKRNKNMRIKYTNEFVQGLGMGDTTACVYEFIYDENYNDETKVIQ